MPKREFKPETVPAMRPAGDVRQELFTDTVTTGFQIVASRKSQSYAAQGNLAGKSVRITIGAVSSMELEAARAECERLREMMERGIDPRKHGKCNPKTVQPSRDPRKVKLGDIWIDLQTSPWWKSRRPATRDLYTMAWDRYLGPWGSTRTMMSIWLGDLIGFWGETTDDGANRRGMARAALILFKRLWSHAARHGFIRDASGRTPPAPHEFLNDELPGWGKVGIRTVDVDDQELPKLRAVLDGPDLRQGNLLVKLLLLTGMRSGEATGLTWGEIDFDNGVINLPAHRTKTNRDVAIPITAAIREMLIDSGSRRRGGCRVSQPHHPQLYRPSDSYRLG